jgi:hypothetical protein
MKKATLGILTVLTALAYAGPVHADSDPVKFRRTLFAPAGQRMVALEAPVGMCFLDPSLRDKQALFQDLQNFLDDTDGGVLLGLFAPCLREVGGAGGDEIPFFGIVTWLNPSVGESTPLALEDYLDLQEVNFRDMLDGSLGSKAVDDAEDSSGNDSDDAEMDDMNGEQATEDSASLSLAYRTLLLPPPGDYEFDKKAHRTSSGVSVGYTAELNRDYIKKYVAGVTATTDLNHVPVAITLSYTQKKPYDRAILKALMDKMVAQQVVLNNK